MSVLNKKPFIQTLIESLSDDEKKSLLSVINGSGTTPKYSLVLRDLSVSTSIERCLLETKTHLYNAYKIYKSNKITFLTYGQGQEMGIYQVNYPYYERELKGKINEPLDINELRRILADVMNEEGEVSQVVITNIKSISDDILNSLKAGDIVLKEDSTGKHAYVVSFKKDGTGICLTYTDASCVETVSYDYTGGHWVYNSTDITLLDMHSALFYEEILKSIPGYDAHKIQTLKNAGEGLFAWVDDEE